MRGRMIDMAGKRLTHEDVAKFFESRDCELLTEKYLSRSQILEFRCYCGRVGNKSYTNFRNVSRCPDCSKEKRVVGLLRHTESKKYSIENVLEFCEKLGLECVSKEFVDVKTPMEFICTSCSEKYERTFENLRARKSTVCRHCGAKKGQRKFAHSYEYVRKFVKENSSSVLLSNKYENTETKMLFECECGNKFKSSFYKFQNRGKRQCSECGYREGTRKSVIPDHEVKARVKRVGYTFVSRDYCAEEGINNINLICNEGHAYTTRFYRFSSGSRCPKCNYSNGERRVSEVLNILKRKYISEHSFSDLKGTGGGFLRFDFALVDDNGEVYHIIEFDGKQHFEPVEIMGGDKNFDKVKKHDALKNEYCERNEIKLTRIPYWNLHSVEKITRKELGFDEYTFERQKRMSQVEIKTKIIEST